MATGQYSVAIILQSPKSRMHKSINSNVQLVNLFVRTVYEWAAMENGKKKNGFWILRIHNVDGVV